MTRPIEWKFKPDAKCYSEEFWYDLTDGGYIKPLELLDDTKQIDMLEKAIKIVYSFQQAYEAIMEESEND